MLCLSYKKVRTKLKPNSFSPDFLALRPPLLEGVLLLVRPLHARHLAVQLFNFGALRLCSSRWLRRSMFVVRSLSFLSPRPLWADKLRSIVCNEDVCVYERIRHCCFDELCTLQCSVDVFGFIISAGSSLLACLWAAVSYVSLSLYSKFLKDFHNYVLPNKLTITL